MACCFCYDRMTKPVCLLFCKSYANSYFSGKYTQFFSSFLFPPCDLITFNDTQLFIVILKCFSQSVVVAPHVPHSPHSPQENPIHPTHPKKTPFTPSTPRNPHPPHKIPIHPIKSPSIPRILFSLNIIMSPA